MYDRKHVKDALVITRINKREKDDAGDVARVLLQLHEAYKCMGDGSPKMCNKSSLHRENTLVRTVFRRSGTISFV